MSRSATQADAEAIARLAARTFPAACPPHTPPEAIEAHIRTELSPSRFREHMTYARFFVVDDDEADFLGGHDGAEFLDLTGAEQRRRPRSRERCSRRDSCRRR